MRPLALALMLLLLASPSHAQAPTEFACEEIALDMTACGTPPALATCPVACLDPDNPTADTCAMLPLPELPALGRVDDAQAILRQVVVTGGPYTGALLMLVSLNASADTTFASARDELCEAPPQPPAPPPPTPTPPGDPGDDTPPVVSGPGLIGGNPGLVGGNPGLVGSNPGINVFRR
jgi:hypothetical protein